MTPTSPHPTVINTSAFLLDSSDMATRTLILCRRLSTCLSAKMGVRCGRLLLNPRNPARLRDIPGRGGSWEPSVGQRKKRKAPKGDSLPPLRGPCPLAPTLSAPAGAATGVWGRGGEEGMGGSRPHQLKTDAAEALGEALGSQPLWTQTFGYTGRPPGNSPALRRRSDPEDLIVPASQGNFLAELGAPIPALLSQPGTGAVSRRLSRERSPRRHLLALLGPRGPVSAKP